MGVVNLRSNINLSTSSSMSGQYDDWFLPSKDLLNAMYTNLHLEGVGGFTELGGYWSSSEANLNAGYFLTMIDGAWSVVGKGGNGYVRACRSFIAGVGDYSLRDVGPAGGLIFHIDGTTYYEAAPSDQSVSQAWSNIIDVLIGTTGTAVGTGQANTTAIINQTGGANDWFLPSKDELMAMYINLYLEGVGGFADNAYWSSTEINATRAMTIWLPTGNWGIGESKSGGYYIRACRSFTDEIGAYFLRDIGPAGGLIFYIDGTTYYEAAPSDQSAAQAWSNVINVEIGASAQGMAVGTGQGNTNAIIGQAGHIDSAAKLCDDLDDEYAHTDSAAKLCDDISIMGTIGFVLNPITIPKSKQVDPLVLQSKIETSSGTTIQIS